MNIKSSFEKATRKKAKTPTNDSALGVYNNAYNAYSNGMNSANDIQLNAHQQTRDNTINQSTTQRNGLSNTAYKNMMKTNLANRQTAQVRGMTGGALEKMAVSNINNYNANVGNVNAGYAGKVANANTTYNQNVANANAELAQNLASKKAELGQANIEYQQTEKQRKQDLANTKADRNMQVLSDTAVGMFNTEKGYKKYIKSLEKSYKKTKDPYYKYAIQYAKLGLYNLKKDQKELKALKGK